MSNYISVRDGGKSSEEGLMKPWYRLFTSGIPISNNPLSLKASQRGAGANMSVDVAIGDVALADTNYIFWGWSDAINNVVISAADPTNPRIDAVVAYLDKSVVSSASNNNPGALKFMAVAGTAAGSPTIPSDGTIQAAVGASNPFVKICSVAVAALASSIVSANITDLRTDVTYKGTVATSSWNNLNTTPTTTTYNGNHSFTQVYNGIDLTSLLPVGTRIRLTRTSAAPSQCATLNGTTQYFSKATPAGFSNTNFPVCSAWIKVTAYAASNYGVIVSKYNGTSGFEFVVDTTGRLALIGRNAGSANFNQVQSYQAVTLNRWIHVAAQLDMSTATLDATHSYILMDGISVTVQKVTGGTAPTAFIQAGNLEIGSENGGTNLFTGQISQVAVYSAAVTQATLIAAQNQTLVGTETSLISAYTLSNSLNDLNANANNLTANGSAATTTADSPFAQGVSAGTEEYGIVTSRSFSTNTTVTIQVAEGSALPTLGGASAVYYSGIKVPSGFPIKRDKFRIYSHHRTTDSTTSNATYGAFMGGAWNLVLPVGDWDLGYRGYLFSALASEVAFNISSTALTGKTVAQGFAASPFSTVLFGAAAAPFSAPTNLALPQSVAAQTTFTMYTFGATTGAGIDGTKAQSEIYAELALV